MHVRYAALTSIRHILFGFDPCSRCAVLTWKRESCDKSGSLDFYFILSSFPSSFLFRSRFICVVFVPKREAFRWPVAARVAARVGQRGRGKRRLRLIRKRSTKEQKCRGMIPRVRSARESFMLWVGLLRAGTIGLACPSFTFGFALVGTDAHLGARKRVSHGSASRM